MQIVEVLAPALCTLDAATSSTCPKHPTDLEQHAFSAGFNMRGISLRIWTSAQQVCSCVDELLSACQTFGMLLRPAQI